MTGTGTAAAWQNFDGAKGECRAWKCDPVLNPNSEAGLWVAAANPKKHMPFHAWRPAKIESLWFPARYVLIVMIMNQNKPKQSAACLAMAGLFLVLPVAAKAQGNYEVFVSNENPGDSPSSAVRRFRLSPVFPSANEARHPASPDGKIVYVALSGTPRSRKPIPYPRESSFGWRVGEWRRGRPALRQSRP